jgi:hypothetical protein
MTKNYTAAGLYSAFYGFLDSAGYFNGATATTLANGADSGAVYVDGIDAFELNPQAPRIVTVPGNNGAISTYLFPADSNPQGSLTVGTFNSNLYALPQSNKVYAEGADWEFVTIQPAVWDFRNIAIVVNTQAQSRDSGTVGLAGYMVEIYPRCQLIPSGGSARQNAQASNFTHSVIANQFDTYPWGKALSNTNEGTTGAVGIRFYSPYPVTMHAFKSDASATTFTTDYTPAAANADKFGIWKAGVKFAYTTNFTLVAATKTITLAAAGTAGDKHICLYQYDPTA